MQDGYSFLEDEMESLSLVVAVAFYITILILLQSRHLKYLKLLSKKVGSEEFNDAKMGLQTLKKRTPLLLLIGCVVQILAIFTLNTSEVRMDYFFSIGIIYVLFNSLAFVNYWLKGAGILKDIGDFNGLP